MSNRDQKSEYVTAVLEYDETVDLVRFGFAPSRREFVGVLGAGLVIAVCVAQAEAQQRPQGQGGQRRGGGGGIRGGGPTPIASRLHIGKDGLITLLTGKVECGQGGGRNHAGGGGGIARAGVARDTGHGG
jgi:hypothetical protein